MTKLIYDKSSPTDFFWDLDKENLYLFFNPHSDDFRPFPPDFTRNRIEILIYAD